MQRIGMFLAIIGAGASAALTGGCKSPPTQSEMAAYDYGPRPENYEKLIRDYLWPKLLDPGSAIVEFKAGPKQLFSRKRRCVPSDTAGESACGSTTRTRAASTTAPTRRCFSSAAEKSSL